MNLIHLLLRSLPLIVISCNLGILSYIVDLQKKNCKCSDNWKKKFIKIASIVIIICSLLVLFSYTFNNYIIDLIFKIFSITYAIIVVLYFMNIHYSSCECAKKWKRYFLLYPIYLFPIMIIILTLLSIFTSKKELKKIFSKFNN